MQKNIVSFVLTVTLLIIVFIWIDTSKLRILKEVSFLHLLVSLTFALLLFFLSGFQYYLVRKQFGISLQLKDILLFPVVMNFWGYIIPIQGSLIFRTLFFATKYKMRFADSFSISVYLFLITLCFSGVFGLLLAINNDLLFSWLSFFSVFFLINPLLIWMAHKLFEKTGDTKIKLVNKAKEFLHSIIQNTHTLNKSLNFTLSVVSTSIAKLMIHMVWFYWISVSLGFGLSILAIGFISTIMNVSLIFKVTPGNLGIAQIIVGGFMGLAGAEPDQAILITLFATANSMFLAFTLGVWGNYHYFKTLRFEKLLRIRK